MLEIEWKIYYKPIEALLMITEMIATILILIVTKTLDTLLC